MASSFPTSIDSFTDPLATSPLNSPSHSAQHADLNDAVEKIETYMGLVFVSSTTIGSGVSSVTVSNCFSSTYDDYKIRITGGAGTGNGFLALQLNNSSTGYYGSYAGSTYSAGAFVGDYMNNATKWTVAGGHTANVLIMNLDLWQPYTSKQTWFQSGSFFYLNAYGTSAGESPAQSHTGFIITPQSGTLTGGTITVYGYRKA